MNLAIVLLLVCAGPETSYEARLIIQAAHDRPVRSVQTGQMDITIQRFAEEHADRMANMNLQGHHQWDSRFHQLERLCPDYTGFREICAESWRGQDEYASAKEMFKSWQQSGGHWSVANGNCAVWGYSMRRGSNGIYYGCGITAHKRSWWGRIWRSLFY